MKGAINSSSTGKTCFVLLGKLRNCGLGIFHTVVDSPFKKTASPRCTSDWVSSYHPHLQFTDHVHISSSTYQSTSAPWDFPLKWEILSLRYSPDKSAAAANCCCVCADKNPSQESPFAGCPTCSACCLCKSDVVVVDVSLYYKPRTSSSPLNVLHGGISMFTIPPTINQNQMKNNVSRSNKLSHDQTTLILIIYHETYSCERIFRTMLYCFFLYYGLSRASSCL